MKIFRSVKEVHHEHCESNRVGKVQKIKKFETKRLILTRRNGIEKDKIIHEGREESRLNRGNTYSALAPIKTIIKVTLGKTVIHILSENGKD